jgi:hypothetical protein
MPFPCQEKERIDIDLLFPRLSTHFLYLVFNFHSLRENVRLNLIFTSSNGNETFKILVSSTNGKEEMNTLLPLHQWE